MDKEDKKQIVEMFEHISEKMATKEDLERFATKEDFGKLESKMEVGFKEVRDDIRSLRTDLEIVEQATESNKGFSEEIDILFGEIKNVKDHVGLKTS